MKNKTKTKSKAQKVKLADLKARKSPSGGRNGPLQGLSSANHNETLLAA